MTNLAEMLSAMKMLVERDGGDCVRYRSSSRPDHVETKKRRAPLQHQRTANFNREHDNVSAWCGREKE